MKSQRFSMMYVNSILRKRIANSSLHLQNTQHTYTANSFMDGHKL